MGEEINGRFTGNRPQRLDRVIQQFISGRENIPNSAQSEIREWIAAGAVAVDGTIKRRYETEVQPGSFLKVKIP
jgi:16S rRNA U516 pseudouridylate synthase RsuA-like enzyme